MKKQKIVVTDETGGVRHSGRSEGGRRIQWESPDGAVRIPEEVRKEYIYPGPFKAAGKPYLSLQSMGKSKEDSPVRRDIYGREVLCMRELFPCFDSYDYANETRYFRWFFIRENGKLTCVFHADESGRVEITEDIRTVENSCLEEMKNLGWMD